MANNPIVFLNNVSFAYENLQVLEEVELAIEKNDFVWVVGPNGGGKTTLMKLILGILSPDTGRIRVFGKSPRQARSRIGYMPQTVHVDPLFPATVLDVALMGRLGNGARFGFYRKKDRTAAEKALDEVGLLKLKKEAYSSLSGGQQRRLLIARALACEPELLILDEPTANLDLVVEKDLFKLLRKLNESLTIIMVSHDPAIVSEFVQRVVCVNRRVSEHPTCEIEGSYLGDLYKGELRLVRHDQHVKQSREDNGIH